MWLLLIFLNFSFAMEVGQEFKLKGDIEGVGGWLRKGKTVVLIQKDPSQGKYVFALKEDPRVIFWKTNPFKNSEGKKEIDAQWIKDNFEGQ